MRATILVVIVIGRASLAYVRLDSGTTMYLPDTTPTHYITEVFGSVEKAIGQEIIVETDEQGHIRGFIPEEVT